MDANAVSSLKAWKKRKRKRGKRSNAPVVDSQQLPDIPSPPSNENHECSQPFTPLTLPAGRKFVTCEDEGFLKYAREHYQGFVHLPVERYEQQMQQSNFHHFARISLERLRDAKYYQYDVVMAGGKHFSRTFVKRTLVGDLGITYKYLGVRLFAHAWSGPNTPPVMKAIAQMNQNMIEMTKQLPNPGLCNYNLTLINYMEPTSHTSIGFKEEADYGMGKISVSWHADSSLESNSSIAVYHCFPTQRATRWDWRIALRPSPDKGDDSLHQPSVAPVAVNTKDGDIYFLLGDFNQNYQHCVLAGSQANRISSTHRVAVTAEDTYEYILRRVKIARKRFRLQLEGIEDLDTTSLERLDAKIVRYCQQVLTEVEMEWIAQYWSQGAEHDKMHLCWQRPMKTLEAYWGALEDYTSQLYQLCTSAGDRTKIPVDVGKVLISELKTRQTFRDQWDERRADKIYIRRISPEYRPVARPVFDAKAGTRLPKDLTSCIRKLSECVPSDVTCCMNASAVRKNRLPIGQKDHPKNYLADLKRERDEHKKRQSRKERKKRPRT